MVIPTKTAAMYHQAELSWVRGEFNIFKDAARR